VNQGGQTRAFKYDSEGHLLFERIPEETATINDGSGTFWTCKYTYTDWSAVATKQDSRGVITTNGYDTLHRLISVSYNTVSGVTTAPAVSYSYDNVQTSNTKGMLLSTSVGSGYSESYSYSVGVGNGGNGGNTLSLQSVTRTIDGRSYVTSYQYNTTNQLTQMTYPVSGRVLNIGHDSVGRVSSLTDQYRTYVSNFSFNGAGQMTGLSLGNVATESYGYDANRMQLTSQVTTAVGGVAGGLMNVSYGYQGTAGQMGAGSTAGNAGQLMSISGSIGGVTETAGYTYDDLGRLVTSNQTSNTASAQRRFAYDRWGNRSGMWDATSGGNQIQQITREQSAGVPTNRLQGVSTARTNVALAANGGTASASSTIPESNGWGSFPPSGAINGDRKGANWESGGGWADDTVNTYPDWIQVSFKGSKTINEMDVFTLQDNYTSPSEPTETMTFTTWGIVDFQAQYWNGSSWQTVPGGSITGNNKVWRKFTFSDITIDKLRVNVTGALNGRSRVVELEAYQSTATYSYDAAGNVTNDGAHSYTYDSGNRLASVDGGSTSSYGYDHQNRRFKKTIGSTVTHYIWQGSQVIAEHDAATGGVIFNYVYSGGRLIAGMGGGVINWCLSDRLSTRLVLDSSGNVVGQQAHLAFGEDFAESGAQQKQHFTTYERDSESGTDYAVTRQYAQTVGRFLQIDPAACNNDNPQTLNKYGYVHNDPVNLSDPDGMLGEKVDRAGGIVARLVNEDDDTDRLRARTSDFTPTNGGGQRRRPPVKAPPRKPTPDVRVVVTVSSSYPGPVTNQAYGHRDTPQALAEYRGEVTLVPPFGGAILFNGFLPGFGFPNGVIPWTHCVSCPACLTPVVCFQEFYSNDEVVRVFWAIMPAPV
jgi:RHS repeat-associated protein